MIADPIPYAAIAADVARALLGEPNAAVSTRAELRYGGRGSLTVHIAGPRAGTWRDHEQDEGGGLLDLIARETKCKNGEAVTWLREHGFIGAEDAKPKANRKIVAEYDYHDANGAMVFQVVRYQPKDFRQRRPDGNGGWIRDLYGIEPVLYRLRELHRAAPGATIYICEGEKDADALRDRLLTATTCPGGAGKWRDGYNDALRGRRVVILPDNDPAGEAHALAVATALRGIAASVRVLRLPDLPAKGDVCDWLAAGGAAEELAALAEAAPEWTPEAEADSGGILRVLRPADCEALQPRNYIVKGLIATGDIGLVVGPPGAGKSLLASFLAYAVAQGRGAFGRRVRGGAVLYLAAEDGTGMIGRVRALARRWGDASDFALVADPIDLRTPESPTLAATRRLIAALRPALVCIDTIARAFPGLAENESGPDGMGGVVLRLRDLAKICGSAVIAAHHVPKAGDTPRGHGALAGDADVILTIDAAEGPGRTARFTKNRNGPSDAPLQFDVDIEGLGTDDDGDPVRAAVAVEAEAGAHRHALPASAAGALRVLCDLAAVEGEALPAGPGWPDAPGLVGVPETRWRAECDTRRVPSAAEAPRSREQAFRRAAERLIAAGQVAAGRGWYGRSPDPSHRHRGLLHATPLKGGCSSM